MAQHPGHDFDPYDETSLDAVETIEFLPDSVAFEHVMYDNLLQRTVAYEYSHSEDTDNMEDVDPLIIDPDLMISQFPEALRGSFPDVGYTIDRLQISQVEAKDKKPTLDVTFFANGKPHHASIVDGLAHYQTINDHMDPVSYIVAPEAITGLLASFLYAKQYDHAKKSQNAIELVEPSIFIPRDPQVDLNERVIMSLGNHSGHASTVTNSMFDNPADTPIVATLIGVEFPDKSMSTNTLSLNEIDDVKDLTTSVETTLYQSIINIEQESPFLGSGKIAKNYAEQRSMVLSALPIPTSEYISPDTNYERWVRTCLTFVNLIKKPMANYKALDETNF